MPTRRHRDRDDRLDVLPHQANPDAFLDVLAGVGLITLAVGGLWAFAVYKIIKAPASDFQPGGKLYTG